MRKEEQNNDDLLRKANFLMRSANLYPYKPFSTIDDLRVATFTNFFVKVYAIVFYKKPIEGIIPNPSTKRELIENLEMVVHNLESVDGCDVLETINCKAVLEGNVDHISKLVDLFVSKMETSSSIYDPSAWATNNAASASSRPQSISRQNEPQVRTNIVEDNAGISEDSKSSEAVEVITVPLPENAQSATVATSQYRLVHNPPAASLSPGIEGNDMLKFSYYWLEFTDARTQRKFEHFLATEANFWISIFALVMPMSSLWLFYLSGEVAYVMKGRNATNLVCMLVAGAIFAATSALYLSSIRHKDKVLSSIISGIDDEAAAGVGNGPEESEEWARDEETGGNSVDVMTDRRRPGVKQGAFSREITMMRTSFFFGMSLVGLLGYFCISRTIYHNCNRVPGLTDSLCILSLPIHVAVILTFASAGLALAIPVSLKGLLCMEVFSKVLALITYPFFMANLHRHIDIARIIVDAKDMFMVDWKLLAFAMSMYYFACLCMLYALCLKSLMAFRRNEMAIQYAVGNERKYFLKNGIWLLT